MHRRFIHQLPPKLVKAHISHRSCQTMIRHHSLDVQILNDDHTVLTCQSGGELVQFVVADIGYLRVELCEFPLGFRTLAASLLYPP